MVPIGDACRVFKKTVQRGRSEVRDAKNNERHVCGRRRDGEPAVGFRANRHHFHPPAPSLPDKLFSRGRTVSL